MPQGNVAKCGETSDRDLSRVVSVEWGDQDLSGWLSVGLCARVESPQVTQICVVSDRLIVDADQEFPVDELFPESPAAAFVIQSLDSYVRAISALSRLGRRGF